VPTYPVQPQCAPMNSDSVFSVVNVTNRMQQVTVNGQTTPIYPGQSFTFSFPQVHGTTCGSSIYSPPVVVWKHGSMSVAGGNWQLRWSHRRQTVVLEPM
jgi:hypothetical protein